MLQTISRHTTRPRVQYRSQARPHRGLSPPFEACGITVSSTNEPLHWRGGYASPRKDLCRRLHDDEICSCALSPTILSCDAYRLPGCVRVVDRDKAGIRGRRWFSV